MAVEPKDGMRVLGVAGARTIVLREDGWHVLGARGMPCVFGSSENREAFIRESLQDGWYVPVDSEDKPSEHDAVEHPKHYTSHPSGVECIQITEHMGFNLGNAIKYIWRADLKHNAIEDLKKAKWYLDRELAKRENADTANEIDAPR